MWISWYYLDPINKNLDQLPQHTKQVVKDDGYRQFSLYTNSLYSGTHRDITDIRITHIEHFYQAILLKSLGLSTDEIQQHIDLGITDDT